MRRSNALTRRMPVKLKVARGEQGPLLAIGSDGSLPKSLVINLSFKNYRLDAGTGKLYDLDFFLPFAWQQQQLHPLANPRPPMGRTGGQNQPGGTVKEYGGVPAVGGLITGSK